MKINAVVFIPNYSTDVKIDKTCACTNSEIICKLYVQVPRKLKSFLTFAALSQPAGDGARLILMETILIKRKNFKKCQGKNVLTSRISAAAKAFMVSGSGCQLQMDVKFWQAGEEKGAIN